MLILTWMSIIKNMSPFRIWKEVMFFQKAAGMSNFKWMTRRMQGCVCVCNHACVCVCASVSACSHVCVVCVCSHDLAPQVLLKCVMLNKRHAGPSGDQQHNCKHRPISCWFCHFLFTISCCSHFTWIIATTSDIYHKLKYDHTRPHNWGATSTGGRGWSK